MFKILYERKPTVYLPEIDAYCAYLTQNYPQVQAYDSGTMDAAEIANTSFDAVWKFMGFDRGQAASSCYVIHEYGSLSVPPFARAKNWLKKMVNTPPQQRVFLNARVQNDFGFFDDIPAYLRDMGIDARFFVREKVETRRPEFDFVYCGSLYRDRSVIEFLRFCAYGKTMGKVLVVGDVTPEDATDLGRSGQVTFTGRIPYHQVPDVLCTARFGLNIIPDIYPYHIQTSTKILEYAAIGLPIISNSYPWVRQFEQERGGRFFYLPKDLNRLTLRDIETFDFATPDVSDLRWSYVIERSGVFDFLSKSIL